MSDHIREPPQARNGLRQSLPFQCGQEVVNRLRRVLEIRPLALGGGADQVWGEVEKVVDEVVRVLCLDAPLPQCVRREVVQIERDDYVSAAAARRSQDVAITEVREREHRDEVFVIDDQAITNMGVHKLPGPLQLLSGEIGAVLQYAANSFLVNCLCPLGAE